LVIRLIPHSEHNYGGLIFTEMSIDAKEKGWEIVTLGNRIYFRSFSKIYEYHNNVITPIDTPFSATDLFVF